MDNQAGDKFVNLSAAAILLLVHLGVGYLLLVIFAPLMGINGCPKTERFLGYCGFYVIAFSGLVFDGLAIIPMLIFRWFSFYRDFLPRDRRFLWLRRVMFFAESV